MRERLREIENEGEMERQKMNEMEWRGWMKVDMFDDKRGRKRSIIENYK